ncbi:COP9 signalosome complex subunit 8 [Drosophila sulfurigaster albostrigata]|uniref:COP9 signalosome complex subunit 8 n=1 Tax=Drosophila sulfurigaster albostrigata TaxID=89887 RepID=UPI002D21CCEF|nr:COP9 signalosome complex subunit 8 [Drosophila sulfurigaster albostrigata]
MQEDSYSTTLCQLENEELENTAMSAENYQQMLAIYLYLNNLANAKMLWMRIPDNLKDQNKELAQINLLNIALQHSNYSDFFKHMKYEWSEHNKAIINDLLVSKREELFNLTASAYVSIYEQNLMEMAQMTPEELKSACFDWTREQDGDKYILIPKIRESAPRVASDDQLLKLTEFVSFLEN